MNAPLKKSLIDFEDQSRDAYAPAVVAHLPLRPGGVDPLGLRQLNFDIMDRALPGLNNVASRLRVYVLLAWAWWKAGELAAAEGGNSVSADRLRAFVDRMEVLFAVSHLLHNDFVGFVGRDTLNSRVVKNGGFDFSGSAWAKFRKDRELVSSFMAPVAYGPSAKMGLGMAVIAPLSGGAFAPVEEMMGAVRAFDAQLAPILDEAPFNRLDGGYVSVDDMARYYTYWRAADLTAVEVTAGHERLHDKENAALRRSSIDLIQHVLTVAARPLTVREVRRALGSGQIDGEPFAVPAELLEAQRTWRALQTRQLLRISLEALLNWVMVECAVPTHTTALAAKLFDALGRPNHPTIAHWLDGPAVSSEVADPITNPVELIEELETTRQSSKPELALAGLKAATRIAMSIDGNDPLYGGQGDRLPLNLIATRLQKMADLPFDQGLEAILAEWIIGQHVYWAVGRSGDDTQRLRLMLDEGGWLSFHANPGNANATPDRLATALRLMSDCCLIVEDRDGPESTYRVPD